MTQEINRYISEIDKSYRAGNATEHTYRPALKTLLENITSGLVITNEPKHIDCGAPDFIITRDSIPLGYIEAKDITVGLSNKSNKAQFERYKQSLGNLIITDYLTFELYVDGTLLTSASIAQEDAGKITPNKKQYDAFIALIEQFINYTGKTIYQSLNLAKMMAQKAKLLAEVIKSALKDKDTGNGSLSGQLEAFRNILIHDISEAAFADMYAQTLAYGLFAARLNQKDGGLFTRVIAAHLVPQSNPFLRKFFQYIAGFDLDSRISWIVDALANLFNAVAIEDILIEFGKANQDPYIHFYETFLAEYDPALRETRGVYYTPLPAVQFIVKAVDDILKTEFGLSEGLADNSKIKLNGQEIHKVQILDPATGTGTFLSEVINNIYTRFANQKGMWNVYCENHLIPRLHGFEILMASYAMAHFKLEMSFKETGFVWKNGGAGKNKRFNIYLTNTLEEAPEKVPELFMAQWLAQEAEEARKVKRDVPIMVVMGNPPYNVSTQNKNEWIDGLIADYKKELNEKNIQPLSDDYLKFIRYGQYLIEKNSSGILAYISNNSFIDGLIHRQMRKTMLDTFDKIYILDLHGNAMKKETTPDGSKDENVFDIRQGTSINIFIKNEGIKTKKQAKVYHADLFGRRKEKYQFLLEQKFSSLKWKLLNTEKPHYFFVPKDFANQNEYEKGFSIAQLFSVNSSGVVTHDDASLVSFNPFSKNNQLFAYRPFDSRYINYDLKKVERHRYKVMKHFLNDENIGLIVSRQAATNNWSHVQVSNAIIDARIHYSNKGISVLMPLYLYPDKDVLDKEEKRRPNLNLDIIKKIEQKINLVFIPEDDEQQPQRSSARNNFTPIDILDYIYAVLHSPSYREKFKEFLKIDFPRVPYPQDAKQFQKLAALGASLRKIHLFEDFSPSNEFALYPINGSNTVENITYKDNKVWINKEQYFDKVPKEAWEFYIGGYQPAQKWLKDRKGSNLSSRTMNFDEIQHYQKIVYALYLTADLQKQIDEVMGS